MSPLATPLPLPSPNPTRRADRIISGYCSGNYTFISRLGRFATSFAPEGHLLIAHNYDTPGMIGKVGGMLGTQGVNISAMSVAPISYGDGDGGAVVAPAQGGYFRVDPPPPPPPTKENGVGDEALMILSVDREVEKPTVEMLKREQGILTCSTVGL